jgi:hypothetical protein
MKAPTPDRSLAAHLANIEGYVDHPTFGLCRIKTSPSGTNVTLCSVVLFAAGSQGSLGRF